MTTVTIAIGILVAIAAILFVSIHVYAYSAIWFSSRRLRAALLRQNRTLSRDEAKQRVARNEGMMLMDAPTLGWNVCRIWWAPTTDFVAGPVWANRDEIVSDADVVNHGRFIDESTGSASLVDGFVMSRRPNEYLKRHFGLDDCAFVFTGAVLTDQYLKNRKSKNA